jgi:serine protease inhibitor
VLAPVLPRERDGLAHLEKQLTRKRLEGQKLGIALAFDSKRADFAGISTCWRLSVSAVLHEAFVKVDEEGTEVCVIRCRSDRVESPQRTQLGVGRR